MIELMSSSARLATPLIFAAMGGLLCERSGIVTICLEGILLISAFTAALAGFYTQNPTICILIGMLTGCFAMMLHWFFTQVLRVEAIISGVAINLIALGTTPLVSQVLFENSNNTPSVQFPPSWTDPAGLVFFAFLLPFLVFPFLGRTVFGLNLRAAGENPDAFRSLGGSTLRIRFFTSLLAGALVALGGVYLSTGHSSQFIREMTAGRGFIALAAVIFGKWQPIRVFIACWFFGFCENIPMILGSQAGTSPFLPTQWIQMIPYVFTLGLLILSHPKVKVATWAK